MRWLLLLAAVFWDTRVNGEHSDGGEIDKGADGYNQLRQLSFLPYETTTTLARRFYFQLPSVEPDADGIFVTAVDPELGERLAAVKKVPRGIPFNAFRRAHDEAASALVKLFLEAHDVNELVSIATQVRDHVNEAIFLYALHRSFYERSDLDYADLPPLEEVLPDRFVPAEVLNKARKQLKHAKNLDEPGFVEVNWHKNETGLCWRSPEHCLAYWREDIFLNRHHWHWHLANPYSIEPGKRDRRGELFYYMHHNMVTRYNMERLSVNINPVEPFEDWRSPIADGYFPHITSGNGLEWANRQDHTLLRDVERISLDESVYVSNLEVWRTHLYHGIDVGYLLSENNTRIRLTDNIATGEHLGIDLLGEAVESGRASVNPGYYGSLHNICHDMISESHDPSQKHQSRMGVMGATETAVRDPVFFRWHKFIDNLFYKYKLTQPEYTPEQLSFADVMVADIRVEEEGEHQPRSFPWQPIPSSVLHTFFSNYTFEASRGIDFALDSRDNISVLLTSSFLNYTEFTYVIKLNNPNEFDITPMVRIFLAPKFDGNGDKMKFSTQLRYWTEMDVFAAEPMPTGTHVIRRNSSSSSVVTRNYGSQSSTTFAFEFCGWPRNLLLPRGHPNGMVFQLFVMVTDADQDRVGDASRSSLCGQPNAKYPDRRPMGFPLDRRSSYETIEDFTANYPNMKVQDVTIKHEDKIYSNC